MRLYTGCEVVMRAPLAVSKTCPVPSTGDSTLAHRRDFRREIVLLLLDAFADDVEREGVDLRIGCLQQLLDALLPVALDEWLSEQRHLGKIFRHRAIDHLLDDVGRLAGLRGA